MSDNGTSDERILLPPIITKRAGKDTSAPTLSSLSEKDKAWDVHRSESDQIESHYQGTEFDRYADRIHFCAEFLGFNLKPTDNGELKLKLFSARFCHVRTCMICSWRKSLRYKARAYKALPQFLIDYPCYKFLFLTLTVKNCEIFDLRETLDWMNKAYTKLSRLKDFPGVGWVKSVEVTKGRRGDAHPHFHCLLVVKSSYFGLNYLSQDKWCELWQKSLKVDYKPVLDVQVLKATGSLVALIAEVIKYQTKPTHLIGDRSPEDKEWFLEYTRQISNTKAISIGGVLKDYFRELEEEPQDLIGNDETDVSEDFAKLMFNWKRKEKKYKLVD